MTDLLGAIVSSITNPVSAIYNGLNSSLGGTTTQATGVSGGLSTDALSYEIDNLYAIDPNFMVEIVCADANGGEVKVQGWMEGVPGPGTVAASYSAPFENAIKTVLDNVIFGQALGNIVEGTLRSMGLKMMTKDLTFQVWEGTSHLSNSITLWLIADQGDAVTKVRNPIAQLYRLVLADDQGGFLSSPGPTPKISDATIDAVSSAFQTFLANFTSSSDTSAGAGPEEGSDPIQTIEDGLSGLFGGNSSTGSSSSLGAVSAKQALSNLSSNLNPLKTALGAAAISADKHITIKVGKYLFFDEVVIESIDPQYENVIAVDGQPMICKVTLAFKTWKVMTIQDIDKLLPGGSTAGGAGQVPSTALTGVWSGLQGAGQAAFDAAKTVGSAFLTQAGFDAPSGTGGGP